MPFDPEKLDKSGHWSEWRLFHAKKSYLFDQAFFTKKEALRYLKDHPDLDDVYVPKKVRVFQEAR